MKQLGTDKNPFIFIVISMFFCPPLVAQSEIPKNISTLPKALRFLKNHVFEPAVGVGDLGAVIVVNLIDSFRLWIVELRRRRNVSSEQGAHHSRTFSCVTGTMGGFRLGRFSPRGWFVVTRIAPQYLLSAVAARTRASEIVFSADGKGRGIRRNGWISDSYEAIYQQLRFEGREAIPTDWLLAWF